MSTVSTIRDKVRAIIPDVGSSSFRSYVYSISNVFTLSEPNAYAVTKVTKNGSTLSPDDYTFDVSTVTVTVSASLLENDVVVIYYDYYDYSDTQLNKFIEAAVIQLSINKYTDDGETYTISEEEIDPLLLEGGKNLVAFIAGILIKPNYSEYRTSTVTLRYPKNEDKDTKIRKLISNYSYTVGIAGTVSL